MQSVKFIFNKKTAIKLLFGVFLFVCSCTSNRLNTANSKSQRKIPVEAEEVIERIKNYHSNTHLVKISWDYRRISTAYSDSDFRSISFVYDSINDFFLRSAIFWKYHEQYGVFSSFEYDSFNYDFGPSNICDSCVRKGKVSNVPNKAYTGAPPYFMFYDYEIGILKHDSSFIEVKKEMRGDSLLITNNFKKCKYTLFVNNLGQYEYYEEELRGKMAGIDIIQRRVLDNFKYKDTSEIDIDFYLSLDECPPYVKSKDTVKKEIVDLDTFFLNKKFDYSKMGGYLDTSIFTNSGKIIILDYSWLGCGPCLLIMNIFPRLLDSFENELQLVFIDPVTDTSQSVFATQLLNKHELNGRVEYKLMSHAEDIFTFNGVIEAYPVLLIIDKNGIVRKVKTGIEKDEDAFETLYKMIKEVLKE